MTKKIASLFDEKPLVRDLDGILERPGCTSFRETNFKVRQCVSRHIDKIYDRGDVLLDPDSRKPIYLRREVGLDVTVNRDIAHITIGIYKAEHEIWMLEK